MTALITPWNYPLLMAAVGSSLHSACTLVMQRQQVNTFCVFVLAWLDDQQHSDSTTNSQRICKEQRRTLLLLSCIAAAST